MKRLLSRLIPALAILAFASSAVAQSTGTLQVRASVAKSCATETVAADVVSINYDVFSTAAGNGEGTGTLSVRCAKDIPIQVEADGGANSASAPAGFNRAVRSASTTELIGYTLRVQGGSATDLPVATADATTVSNVLGDGKNAVDVEFTVQLDTTANVEPATDYNDDVVVTFTPEP